MAIYQTGSIRLMAGSAIVVGTGTAFNTNVSAGYLLKVTAESTTYEISSVNSATRLTLSSRYTSTNHQTARAENIASGTTATKVYSGTLTNTPVIQSEVVIKASAEDFTDDGAGTLTGDGGGSGTVGYDDGAWSIILATDLTATVNISASYYSGDTRNSLSYQIVTDYTTNYNLPEMGLNDTNFQHIYTKAIRLIDSNMYDASVNTIVVASHVKINTGGAIQMGSHQYIIFGAMTTQASVEAAATAVDASCKGSLYISTDGHAWIMTDDTTAASFTQS